MAVCIKTLQTTGTTYEKWAILGPKIAHPHSLGSAGRMFLKFYTMIGANR